MLEQLFDVEVAKRTDLTEDLFIIELRPLEGSLPSWNPGAHIDVEVGDKSLRQYSLAGSAANQQSWVLGVRREVEGRGGSNWIYQNAKAGSIIKVSAPRNHFAYKAGVEPVVFVAGGIGVTPLVPMIHAAANAGRPWQLHFVASTKENMPFLPELQALGGEVHVYARDVSDRPNVAAIIDQMPAGSSIYCCGPEALMQTLEHEAKNKPEIDAYVERFVPKEQTGDAGLDTFEVNFAYSQIVATVGPGQSILDVARASGIEVVSSCQEGTCGSCETPIISGTPAHRDSVLSEKERIASTCMMICVSRSCTPTLELDL